MISRRSITNLCELLVLVVALAVGQACSEDDKDDPSDGPDDQADVQTIVETVFNSDPTQQDSNDDNVMDWVIRDRESDHLPDGDAISIQDGAYHSENGDPLDSRPRMDYPDHTELIFSARSLGNDTFELPTVGQIYGVGTWPWVGAQTWINFHYDVEEAHWAAVFTQIYRTETEQVFFVINQIDENDSSTDLVYKILYVQSGLPLDEFVDVKLHLYISEEKVGITVNGEDQGKVAYERKFEAEPKDDRFVTLYAPSGGTSDPPVPTVAEWKSLTLQVAAP